MPWVNLSKLANRQFRCGYCGSEVASSDGWFNDDKLRPKVVYICPRCAGPTLFYANAQTPAPVPGNAVSHVPKEVADLYDEARRCISASAFTASVLSARKLLMHIAVANGAKEGETFLKYVEHLSAVGFIPPNGKGWVDHIRQKGNEANHEIRLMTVDDAKELVDFSEMLLKFIYEFPARIKKP